MRAVASARGAKRRAAEIAARSSVRACMHVLTTARPLSPQASGRDRGSFRKSDERTKLELELLEMSSEFEAAELAEINLVEAFCVPVLSSFLKPPSPPPTPPPYSFASTPATAPTTAAMSTFCRSLLECRSTDETCFLIAS